MELLKRPWKHGNIGSTRPVYCIRWVHKDQECRKRGADAMECVKLLQLMKVHLKL